MHGTCSANTLKAIRSESMPLAVEAVMKAYARRLGEDEEKWGIAGMLHDFDYEMYPTRPTIP